MKPRSSTFVCYLRRNSFGFAGPVLAVTVPGHAANRRLIKLPERFRAKNKTKPILDQLRAALDDKESHDRVCLELNMTDVQHPLRQTSTCSSFKREWSQLQTQSTAGCDQTNQMRKGTKRRRASRKRAQAFIKWNGTAQWKSQDLT